jgi:hypothetical protein
MARQRNEAPKITARPDLPAFQQIRPGGDFLWGDFFMVKSLY